MKNTKAKAIFFFLLIWLANGAFGQSYRTFMDEWKQIVQTARFSFGPFRIFPYLNFKNLGFDNNIFFEDHPVPDFSGTISPEVRVYWPLRESLLLSFRENPEYVFYLNQKQQRGFTNSYSFGLKYLLFHRIVFSADYLYGEHLQRVSSELGRPTTDAQREYSFGLFYETARKTSIGITASVNRLSFKDIQTPDEAISLSQTLNRTERNANFEFYYQLFRDGYFFVKAGCTEFGFEQTSLERDSYSYQATGGLRFPMIGPLQGTCSFGYVKIIPRGADKTGYSGFVSDAGIDARIRRLGIHLGYKRGFNFSYFEKAFIFVDNRLSGGISVYLTDFLRINYSYELGYFNYPEALNVPSAEGKAVEVGRNEKQGLHSGSLVLRVYKTIGLGVTFISSRWTANVPGVDRNRSSIGAYLTYQF